MAVVITFGVLLIIGLFVTLWLYMYYCSENEISIFANPRYADRICELEAKIKKLENFMANQV